MKIKNADIEKQAIEAFKSGNKEEGTRLQEEFVATFREEYSDKDHCSCQKECRYHGNCKECVAIHRAHEDHLPDCMHEIVNARLVLLSEITEHSFSPQTSESEE